MTVSRLFIGVLGLFFLAAVLFGTTGSPVFDTAAQVLTFALLVGVAYGFARGCETPWRCSRPHRWYGRHVCLAPGDGPCAHEHSRGGYHVCACEEGTATCEHVQIGYWPRGVLDYLREKPDEWITAAGVAAGILRSQTAVHEDLEVLERAGVVETRWKWEDLDGWPRRRDNVELYRPTAASISLATSS